jgi:predicted MPP superfamily phosphohydrolase
MTGPARPASTAGRALLGLAAVGAACVAYGAGYEARAFRLRRHEIPVLRPGSRPMRVLHLSDLHLLPGQEKKRAWVRRLDELRPDLVISTGDHISHRDSVPALLDALGPLLERPGAFVFGSNDYYEPRFRNPARYLAGPSASPERPATLPFEDMRAQLRGAGWADLNNDRTVVVAGERDVELIGVDDPHIERDRYDDVAGGASGDADLALGVMHAPYRRVLDAMAADRLPLLLAGHTHGGQLCVPGLGALITNCDLPRGQAKGLSQHVGPDGERSWLHVSAGLGTSPFAPIRFACPPEATLLTLLARDV